MNERIEQLAEQAGYHINGGKIFIRTTSEDITSCQQKFAELIVRECTTIMQEDTSPNCPYVDYFKVTNKIKQHFGVEE